MASEINITLKQFRSGTSSMSLRLVSPSLTRLLCPRRPFQPSRYTSTPRLHFPYNNTTARSNSNAASSLFTDSNIFADGTAPPVQVASITERGIQLADGLVIPSACIFLDGKVFLWDVPEAAKWTKEHAEVFDVVIPKPEILLLGTGREMSLPPPSFRTYLTQLGIQVDVMDTRNACSTYNVLAEEGRRVAAALLPISPMPWRKPNPGQQ